MINIKIIFSFIYLFVIEYYYIIVRTSYLNFIYISLYSQLQKIKLKKKKIPSPLIHIKSSIWENEK